ncbi:Nucleic acid dioxygenase alkbh1 [Halocaridina rubra]|uniref:Nucleic acid dioxygenase alkbh1 n=1 Tax=Halocaridina rubra TaxID=373956 RepID=A0AAN9A1D7_HALRR
MEEMTKSTLVGDCNDAEDRFKEAFKYYKRRKPPPDMKDILQVGDDCKGVVQIPGLTLCNTEENEVEALGLIPFKLWKIWTFSSHPGLVIIQNPFTREGQMKWIHDCLTKYSRPPNKTNLASHGITQCDKTWWEQSTSTEGKKTDLIKKLRWATLGYHHNWDTKEYSESNRGEMPSDLMKLCNIITKVLGYEEFRAEAAIINYYHMDSSLGPHTDHSEPNRSAPLLSFSFGQGAIFLIGGSSKETKPTALLLHSGDIMIMAGASRLAYHAVPRIIKVPEEPWKIDYCDQCFAVKYTAFYNCEESLLSDGKEKNTNNRQKENFSCTVYKSSILTDSNRRNCSACKSENYIKIELSSNLLDILEYAKTSRININVRQVLLSSMKNLQF